MYICVLYTYNLTILKFVHLFQTLGLFSYLGFFEQCCSEHGSSCISEILISFPLDIYPVPVEYMRSYAFSQSHKASLTAESLSFIFLGYRHQVYKGMCLPPIQQSQLAICMCSCTILQRLQVPSAGVLATRGGVLGVLGAYVAQLRGGGLQVMGPKRLIGRPLSGVHKAFGRNQGPLLSSAPQML